MDFALARINMVKSQVAPIPVQSSLLLESLGDVPRELFVEETWRPFAYADMNLPLSGEGRSLLKPLLLARLIEALQVEPQSRVLVVGGGGGYEAAVLARMGAEVFVLESDAALAAQGEQRVGAGKAQWRVGDLALGWPEVSPFDAILLCGALTTPPNKLIGQLGRQGRLVTVMGQPGDAVMRAVRMVGISGGDRPDHLFETTAPLLPGMEGANRFVL
ncbi:MAG: protein-L-isoaspartate O-methyltransferase [Magnetococcales bacterium]|nr:protein-L-isoaspartate O-methyltransferase [Magnetococcales bacterium]